MPGAEEAAVAKIVEEKRRRCRSTAGRKLIIMELQLLQVSEAAGDVSFVRRLSQRVCFAELRLLKGGDASK